MYVVKLYLDDRLAGFKSYRKKKAALKKEEDWANQFRGKAERIDIIVKYEPKDDKTNSVILPSTISKDFSAFINQKISSNDETNSTTLPSTISQNRDTIQT